MWFSCFISLFIIVILLRTVIKNYSIHKSIQNIRLVPISSVKDGPVKCRGRITPTRSLKSPENSKDCVAYCIRIEQWKLRLFSSRLPGWETVGEIKRIVNSSLDDGTAKILLRSEVADFEMSDIRSDGFYEGITFYDLPDSMQRVLKENGFEEKSKLGVYKTLRITVKHILPDDTVYVTGYLKNTGTPRIDKEKDYPFIISESEEGVNNYYCRRSLIPVSAIIFVICFTWWLLFFLPDYLNQ